MTHAHLDHSPLAARLAAETGAPVLAYGGPEAGRSAVMERLADAGEIGGGEGVDAGFAPDLHLEDGETITGDGWQITAHWTPGHFGNHMCFESGGTMFSGDLVMGWASTLISPPDGDLRSSAPPARASPPRGLRACCRATARRSATRQRASNGCSRIAPREAAILRHLAQGPTDAATLARRIYTDTPAALMPAAAAMSSPISLT